MSKSSAAAEPSMEEILASIRRIIADGDGGAGATKPAAPAEPAKAESPLPAASPRPAPEKPAVAKTAPPEPAPASQDDIDALMAAAVDEEEQPEEEEDVLDLAMARVEEEVSTAALKPVPAKSMARVEAEQDVDFEEPPAEIAIEMPAPAPVVRPAVPVSAISASDSSLLSREAEASVSAAFGTLTQAIFSNEPRTIEDVMKELLRPMVKTWLDDNLPAVVERLVREEISRVARGRR